MPKESVSQKKQRTKKVVDLLKRYHPEAHCSLRYSSSFQLLVATILSAQCTDERVNRVTKTLFKKYPDAEAFSKARLKELEKEIYSTGFFRSKAQKIREASRKIQKNFNAEVPSHLDELLTLDGVGRKTAHVILGTAFGIESGVVVDTHVRRLSRRLNFTDSKNPQKIEEHLCSLLPRTDWIYFSHALIHHGREVCKARVPRCSVCFLQDLCPKKEVKT